MLRCVIVKANTFNPGSYASSREVVNDRVEGQAGIPAAADRRGQPLLLVRTALGFCLGGKGGGKSWIPVAANLGAPGVPALLVVGHEGNTRPHSPQIPPNEKGPEGYKRSGPFNMAER